MPPRGGRILRSRSFRALGECLGYTPSDEHIPSLGKPDAAGVY
ncbi:hypothetical protein [Thiorhodospira sibirica]|nr:hypothetical protein [Thiorhodospira sibirica]